MPLSQTWHYEETTQTRQLMQQSIPGDKNISIFRLSCRTSDLKFSLVLQTHALVL